MLQNGLQERGSFAAKFFTCNYVQLNPSIISYLKVAQAKKK